MVSRVCLLVTLVVVTAATTTASAARQPPSGTAMYLVEHDLRRCASPRCGGYWVTIANGARTRCVNGLRQPRCYVARARDGRGRPVDDIPEGALVRGAMVSSHDGLGALVAGAAYAPAGTAVAGGGWYRVVDNGIRCVRAPCFSYTAHSVNARTRIRVSDLDLQASQAAASEIARALRAVSSTNGLYARGRFARTPEGGTVFRGLGLYLRAPLPRA